MDLTTIIEALVALIAAVISVVVIPYVRSKLTAQQFAELENWVRVAVAAAEQLYKGTGRGAERKQYVLDFLNKHSISVDMERLDALIEAAVHTLHSSVPIILEGVTADPQ
jgi:hypothetical protein